MNGIIAGLFAVIIGIAIGIIIGVNLGPTTDDVVTLDNQRCILIYEQGLIHKFCEAE